ncbi:MAG: copper resistance protein CopC [Chloroflexi bacterium]|nr:copper resistance protein CopC [Chloroflexota bacterium]
MNACLVWRWLRLLGVLVALGFGFNPGPASAHALLLSTTPAAGTVSSADGPPGQVSLVFSEPVEVTFNAIAVLDSDSRRVDRLDARVAADDARRVDVSIGTSGALAQGAYLVRWRATSLDNHLVGGSFWFAVGFATALPAAALIGAGAPTIARFEVLGRWLALLSVLALAGAPFFLLWVLQPARSRLTPAANSLLASPLVSLSRLWLVSLIVFIAAHLVWAVAQAEAVAELPVPQALDTPILRAVLVDSRFAVLWWSRMVLGLLLAVVLLADARTRHGLDSRPMQWVAGGLAVVLCMSVTLGGHAAGARWLAPLAVGMDTLHLVAAAIWLGGLAQVAVLLPRVIRADAELRSDVLRILVPNTSKVALASVLVLAATGAFAAWEQTGSLEALATTAYGQTLVVKLAIVVALLALGAVNLLVIRPGLAARSTALAERAAPLARRFRSVLGAELALGGAVLLATATLTSLPPPGVQGLPATVDVARQAGDLRLQLSVAPDWVGVSRFRVAVADAQGQTPPDVSNVILTFTMEGMNMGRTTVRASPIAPGIFEAEGFYIGMPGFSLIGAAVSRSAGAEQSTVFRVEVPNVSQHQFEGLPPTLGLGTTETAGLAAADPDSLIRGQASFESHCVICHGSSGTGNGPAAASLLPPPADLTLHARWHSDAQLFWFITHGVTGTAMPSFADQLTPAERWEVIGHLHALAAAPSATTPREAATGPAQAAPPTSPAGREALSGRLVFGPDSDKDFWLWRFPLDAPERLTQFSRLDFASHPVWSPDGQRLAFSFYSLPRVGAIPAGTDLHIMDGDGANLRLLVAHDTPGAALLYPAWVPDGSGLYVTHQARAPGGGSTSNIERVDVRIGALQPLVANAAYPSPSRDGRLLAYVSIPNPDGRSQSLWLSSTDGRDPRQLLAPGVFVRYSSVRFAPDGQRILFAAVGQGRAYAEPRASGPDLLGVWHMLTGIGTAHADGEEWDLWTIEPDGRNLHRLTTIAEDLPVATWSSSGERIAFLGGGSARTAETGLVVMTADGATLQRLTSRPGHRGADWSPVP